MLCEEWIFWVVSGNDKIVVGNGEERRMEKFEEQKAEHLKRAAGKKQWGDGAGLVRIVDAEPIGTRGPPCSSSLSPSSLWPWLYSSSLVYWAGTLPSTYRPPRATHVASQVWPFEKFIVEIVPLRSTVGTRLGDFRLEGGA